jgi:IS605 OrfB family transposase
MSNTYVEKHHISKEHPFWQECDELCYAMKNLYNRCLYEVRQHFLTKKTFTYKSEKLIDKITQEEKLVNIPIFHYNILYHLAKEWPEFRTVNHKDLNGRYINTKVLKQVYHQLHQDFSSHWKALETYTQDKTKFQTKPHLPNYKKTGLKGRMITTFPFEAISFGRSNKQYEALLENHTSQKLKSKKTKRITTIQLASTKISLPIDLKTINKETLLEVKVVPTTYGYDLIISYDLSGKALRKNIKAQQKEIRQTQQQVKKQEKELNTIYYQLTGEKRKKSKITEEKRNLFSIHGSHMAGMDLGLTNLMAIAFHDPSLKKVVIKGGALKYENQKYNKLISKKKSQLPKGVYTSDLIQRITQNRNNFIDNFLHKASKVAIDILIKNQISSLVVGWNKRIKDGINIGDKNNQNFVQIPFAKLRHFLKYKCEKAGIEYIETEESYTSKCSFIEMEDLKHAECYAGQRIKRGLFRDSQGRLINADSQGALNMLRKVINNECFVYFKNKHEHLELKRGYAVAPIRINISL